MSKKNYSIIIPHYNVPELLLRCLQSIPVREDTEVIVVDDCSENFNQCKKKIEVSFPELHVRYYSTKKNSGPGIARNIGLDHAKGKWIIFQDSDDFFSEEFAETLNRCVDRPEDILYFHSKAVMSGDISQASDEYIYDDILKRYVETNNDEELRYGYYSVCGRLIKHSLIEANHLRFEGRFHGEDLLFSVQLGHRCNRITVLPDCLNVVTNRKGSLSRSWEDWGEWYRQFFPAHIKAMHYLHGYGLSAIDSSVYGKLFTIMRLDLPTFRILWGELWNKEKCGFLLFVMKKMVKKFFK